MLPRPRIGTPPVVGPPRGRSSRRPGSRTERRFWRGVLNWRDPHPARACIFIAGARPPGARRCRGRAPGRWSGHSRATPWPVRRLWDRGGRGASEPTQVRYGPARWAPRCLRGCRRQWRSGPREFAPDAIADLVHALRPWWGRRENDRSLTSSDWQREWDLNSGSRHSGGCSAVLEIARYQGFWPARGLPGPVASGSIRTNP